MKIEDEDQLPKLEAQAWLAIYNLLSKDQCKDKYELHHYRITQLTKLSGLINETKSSQLPILSSLKEWLVRQGVANAGLSAPPKVRLAIYT